MLTSYSFAKVLCLVNAFRIHGHGKDTGITFENQDGDSTLEVGADGEATVVMSSDKSYTALVTVMSSIPSYRRLARLREAQRSSVGPIVPVLFSLTDPSNGDIITDSNAVILNSPMPAKGKGISEVTFRIALPSPSVKFGTAILGI